MNEDIVKKKGPLHWSKARMKVIHSVIILSIIIFFLFSFLYPVLSYQSWKSSDLDYNDGGRAYMEISDIGPGTLYIRAYCLNIGYFIPGNDPEEEDEKDTSVRLTVKRDDDELNGSDAFIWTKFVLSERGAYSIVATNPEGYDILMNVRYIAKCTGFSLCFSCLVIPILSIIYAAAMLVLSRKRKKFRMRIGEFKI